MTEEHLTDKAAEILIEIEKWRLSEAKKLFPSPGESFHAPLRSHCNRYRFRFNCVRGRRKLNKVSLSVLLPRPSDLTLVRVDILGPPHENPDGKSVECPHIHLYREGHNAGWAYPLDPEAFTDPCDLGCALRDFFRYCNITRPPNFQQMSLDL